MKAPLLKIAALGLIGSMAMGHTLASTKPETIHIQSCSQNFGRRVYVCNYERIGEANSKEIAAKQSPQVLEIENLPHDNREDSCSNTLITKALTKKNQ